MKLIINKPEGLGDSPHHWTIECDDGMFVAAPLNLRPEARARQAKIVEKMVSAYNEKFGDDSSEICGIKVFANPILKDGEFVVVHPISGKK